ncbi:MAG TPA: caspase family protein [Acetobacteraceae bacterium]
MRATIGGCFRLLLLAVAICSTTGAHAQQSERRVALVIGNAGYQHVDRLANPGNDAKLIADTLQKSGFTLVGGGAQRDLDKAAFDRLVRDFGQQIQGAEVALFYYAGHGMQVEGSNWLLPVDANPTRAQDLDFQLVNADLVLKQMDGAGTRLNIVLLDACQMRAPEGTLISFATQPGNVAVDGTGPDGPYAMALADAIRQPGLDIFRLFNQVGLKVKRATQGSQQPWVSSSPIDGEFYFARSESSPDVIAAPALEAPPPMQASPSRDATAKPAPVQATDAQQSLRELAEQGQPQAQIDLGLLYAKGLGVAKDYPTAMQWFQRAAGQGAPRALFLVGLMYERGFGVPRNYDTALDWYRRAAAKNAPLAELALARFYGQGLGVERDPAQRAAWLLRAANQGNPQAQFILGNIYRRGIDVPQDPATAAQWYQRAVLQEFVPAEMQLGLMYEHGNGVPHDNAQAARLLRLASDKGNAVAQNALGMMYRRGQGVKQDYAQAQRWLRASAEQGNGLGALNLGILYAEGLGVPRDRVEARKWFGQAAAAGNEAAAARLARLDAAPHPP